MRCPQLKDLPAPPPGRTGWPWTEECGQLPDAPPGGGTWPKITIVTPSFNQGQYLEETIRSVLLQGYPNLEYVLIDGGSRDESVEVIRRYEPWLSHWVSERDRGQSHAINKGLERMTGDLFGWINSDDLLMPDGLATVAAAHLGSPGDLIVGDVINFWDDFAAGERELLRQGEFELKKFVEFWNRSERWHQPGVFFPASVLSRTGHLDESLDYLFDYDLICRALDAAGAVLVPDPLAAFRLHSSSKTVSQGELFYLEACRISRRYWHLLPRVDAAGYRRYASGLLFCTGCSRALRGQSKGLGFVVEGLKTHPAHALLAALRLLPASLRRKRRARLSTRAGDAAGSA